MWLIDDDKSYDYWSSGQDGGVGRNAPSLHNQKKENNQFKNNKQPELPE